MELIEKTKKYIKDPLRIYSLISRRGWTRFVPDEVHLRIMYRVLVGGAINLDDPKGFNEKLNWLKLHDRNPLYNTLVDKIAVKKWVSDIIGDQYVTDTYGSWADVDEIPLTELPERFVLKTNHDSGGIAICRNKSTFDFERAKKKLRKHLKRNYFWWMREWPYKDVTPAVMAEEYLEDAGSESGLVDYKVTCFNGVPQLIEVHKGRFGEHTCNYYDQNWNPIEMKWGDVPMDATEIDKPLCLDEMLQLSSMLAQGTPQIRCDWYLIEGRLVFGELTLFNGSGFDPIDEQHDLWLGSLIDLSLAYGDR